MNKHHITLSDGDRLTLTGLLTHGTLSAKKFKRATALLELDRGKSLVEVAATLQVTYPTVSAWRAAYTTSGLACLDDAPRSGRPIEIDGTQRAKDRLPFIHLFLQSPDFQRAADRLVTGFVIESTPGPVRF